MKTLRSALALSIAASLILLSPGAGSWAAAADIAGAVTAPLSNAGAEASAAGAMTRGSVGTLIASPSMSLTAAPSVFTAPVAMAPAAMAPAAASPISTVPLSAGRSASVAPLSAAVSAPIPSVDAAAEIAVGAPRRDLPNFSKLSGGETKGAVSAYVMSRVAGWFRRAPSADTVSVPRGESAVSALSRYRAAPASAPAVPAVARTATRVWSAVPFLSFGKLSAIGHAALSSLTILSVLTFPMAMISFILHEIGHAKLAAALGDRTAADKGLASLNPMTWLKHVDPLLTTLLPVGMFLRGSPYLFGAAKAVPVNPDNFKHPRLGMAAVAMAGPAVNLALAAVGALAYVGAVSFGFGALVLGSLTAFVFINALIAIFNLLPVPPLDGGQILISALLPHAAAQKVRAFFDKVGVFGLLPVAVIALLCANPILLAATAVTHGLIALAFAVTTGHLAIIPVSLAVNMAVALGKKWIKHEAAGAPGAPPPAADQGAAPKAENAPVNLVVIFSSDKAIAKDLHLSSVDPRAGDYATAYPEMQRSLLAQLSEVGLSADALASYGAAPVASYRRINAATISVAADKAAAFEAALRAQGHRVYRSEAPQAVVPAAKELSPWQKLKQALFPQPPAPAAASVPTLDDKLKSLTAAANDENAVISNPWNSEDPESPEALLVKKLAEEGRTIVPPIPQSSTAQAPIPPEQAAAQTPAPAPVAAEIPSEPQSRQSWAVIKRPTWAVAKVNP